MTSGVWSYGNRNSTAENPACAAAPKRSRNGTSVNIIERFAANFGIDVHYRAFPSAVPSSGTHHPGECPVSAADCSDRQPHGLGAFLVDEEHRLDPPNGFHPAVGGLVG